MGQTRAGLRRVTLAHSGQLSPGALDNTASDTIEDIMGDDVEGDYGLLFEEQDGPGDARLFFANFTSSLIAVNSTLLLLAAAALGGLAALAYLFYTLSQNQSSGGGYGSYGGSQSYGSGYSSDGYGRYRRDTSDTEWIRILTLLDVGSDLYNNMSHQNMEDSCPAKILCQALESSDIFGNQDSYIKRFYQFMSAVQFKHFSTPDQDSNSLEEKTSSCSTRYPQCHLSLLSSFQEAFENRKNAKLEFVWK